jgi:hypothetical protein
VVSRTPPIARGRIMRSSMSAAVIADTVGGLRSVFCAISTLEIGPERRIASITWKRLIARINSGSAVFIGERLSQERAWDNYFGWRFNHHRGARCQCPWMNNFPEILKGA